MEGTPSDRAIWRAKGSSALPFPSLPLSTSLAPSLPLPLSFLACRSPVAGGDRRRRDARRVPRLSRAGSQTTSRRRRCRRRTHGRTHACMHVRARGRSPGPLLLALDPLPLPLGAYRTRRSRKRTSGGGLWEGKRKGDAFFVGSLRASHRSCHRTPPQSKPSTPPLPSSRSTPHPSFPCPACRRPPHRCRPHGRAFSQGLSYPPLARGRIVFLSPCRPCSATFVRRLQASPLQQHNGLLLPPPPLVLAPFPFFCCLFSLTTTSYPVILSSSSSSSSFCNVPHLPHRH